MLQNVNKHLFFSIIYFIAAVASGIGSYVNDNISILFIILTGVFLVLAILSLTRYMMSKPKKL
ncbi:hypothetical protein AB3N04_17515 [Alkalihalophilus sp. As8PL]|uniref:DUF1328 domain-containing protein n=1 Tax=Alkalihalophilus sp. As8PL TaxID=3237103 RepID=A0AB39BSR6_9BACI